VEGVGEGDGGVLQGGGHSLMHFSSSGSGGRYWTALSFGCASFRSQPRSRERSAMLSFPS